MHRPVIVDQRVNLLKKRVQVEGLLEVLKVKRQGDLVAVHQTDRIIQLIQLIVSLKERSLRMQAHLVLVLVLFRVLPTEVSERQSRALRTGRKSIKPN